MKNIGLLLLLLISIAVTSSCSIENKTSKSAYLTISSKEAKEMIDNDTNIVILDVRTKEEYSTGHIEGAILIPNNEILDSAEEELADKSATILVYCRSGRRSAEAAADLVSLGYSYVYDFGGIIDWEFGIYTPDQY